MIGSEDALEKRHSNFVNRIRLCLCTNIGYMFAYKLMKKINTHCTEEMLSFCLIAKATIANIKIKCMTSSRRVCHSSLLSSFAMPFLLEI